MTDIHEGGCLCGAVRYRVTGEPVAAYVCHCNYCQKSSGTAFQMPVFFKHRQVEFSGEPMQTFDYVSPAHGRTVTTQFCGRCGTRVGSRITRAPGIQILSAGSFDVRDQFSVNCHLFTETKVPWVRLPPETPCYEKHFITEEGEKVEPLAVTG